MARPALLWIVVLLPAGPGCTGPDPRERFGVEDNQRRFALADALSSPAVELDSTRARWRAAEALLPAPVASEQSTLSASDGASRDTYGYAVSRAGDVDGDGYDDVLVGAYLDDDNGEDSGSAYVYYGSATGLRLDSEDKITASDGAAGDQFGTYLSGAADVNGDGYDDLLICAWRDQDNGWDSGSAYVYYGSATGVSRRAEDKLVPTDGLTSGRFGFSVGGAGDVDGDGHHDILVGSYGDDDNGPWSGSTYVYYGTPTGVSTATEQKLVASDGLEAERFGNELASAGDINGDGYDDIIVGADGVNGNGRESGAVYIYYGSATGLSSASEDKLEPADGAAVDWFGESVRGAGDLDGDGYDDVAIGAHLDDDNGEDSGSVYLYYGSATGIARDSVEKLTPSDGEEGDVFGRSVSSAGDVDSDGYDDLLVGAFGDDDNGADSGAAYLYYGSPTGLARSTEEKLLSSSGRPSHNLGRMVSGAGDVDGDGYHDVVVGVPGDDPAGVSSGSALVFAGGCRDQDADGSCSSEDCDDTDATVHPRAEDVPEDGVDQDCDGVDATSEEEEADTAEEETDTADQDASEEAAEQGGPDAGDGEGCGCSGIQLRAGRLGGWVIGVLGVLLGRRRRTTPAAPAAPRG